MVVSIVDVVTPSPHEDHGRGGNSLAVMAKP
jgi:hypothetical protein